MGESNDLIQQARGAKACGATPSSTLGKKTSPPERERHMPRKIRPGLALAALIAVLGWTALGTELVISLRSSFADGSTLIEALYGYFRFFTILSNIGVAILMTATCLALRRNRLPPPTAFYGAALAYMLITGVTYELLLRRLWSPRGVQILSDATMHDVVPSLVLIFWIGFAPRDGARWRDPLWMLIFPLIYFVVTLVAGAEGAGYPYNFLDATKLGYGAVGVVALLFLTSFLVIGLATTAVSKWRARRTP